MIVLVCGGRDYDDQLAFSKTLDAVHARNPITMLVHGGAKGADMMADDWARTNGIHVARVDALWNTHGRSAGPRRNEAMLRLRPNCVIAFPGGRGTENMIALAKANEVKVLVIGD